MCAKEKTTDHDKLLFSLLVFQRTHFALFVVDLLLHIGWDTRYTDETPLSVVFVRACILIWALSLSDESYASSKAHSDNNSVGYNVAEYDREREGTWKRKGGDDMSFSDDNSE